MSKIKNKIENILPELQNLIQLRPHVPIHPDWLIVQWGYVAIVFTALLIATIPVAALGTMKLEATATSFEKGGGDACIIERSSQDTEKLRECKAQTKPKLIDWPNPNFNLVPTIPLRLINDRGGESAELSLRKQSSKKGS